MTLLVDNEVALNPNPRDDRKGRHSLVILKSKPAPSIEVLAVGGAVSSIEDEVPTVPLKILYDIPEQNRTVTNIGRMFDLRLAFHDLVNGIITFWPLFGGLPVKWFTHGGSISGFFGSCIYLFGAILTYLEVVNATEDKCFPYSMKQVQSGDGQVIIQIRPAEALCAHHHRTNEALLMQPEAVLSNDIEVHVVPAKNKTLYAPSVTSIIPNSCVPTPSPMASLKPSSVSQASHTIFKSEVSMESGVESYASGHLPTRPSRRPILIPSYRALRYYFVYRIAFQAAILGLISSTINFAGALSGLPGMIKGPGPQSFAAKFNSTHPPSIAFASVMPSRPSALVTWVNWGTQILASIGFGIVSIMLTIEVQETWWKPAPRALGWWVGVWSLLGSLDFFLSGVFGFIAWPVVKMPDDLYLLVWLVLSSAFNFQAAVAFLVAAVLQLYESVDKYPIKKQGKLD